ncbi:MAG: prolyl-tRNA synthetase [Candidatus Taylorbacteria bacterium]|nr:prolyl-tRNA synthetase [Candidatus Taylorbacteria bacterium]
MLQSELFTKTRKEGPKDEVARNAQLLIRAGYIHKEMAGVYSFLPLGLRVLNKIVGIIREEMNAIGGQELFLTALQDPAVWKTSGRWSEQVVDNWFKTEIKTGGAAGLGFTHEEPIVRLMKDHIHSYRDLPKFIYQFQTKFRNEERAKSGILRTREFLMKDLYSFARDEKEHAKLYEKVKSAYSRIFNRAGVGRRTFLTFASGGSFSKYSHEFQTVCDAGEDTIYLDEKKEIAVNKEVLAPEVLKELGLKREGLTEKKAVEVGNIFSQGIRFSEPLGLTFKDEAGTEKPVVMGAYGIGPGRLLGAIVELLADKAGLVWPASVAPFQVHLVSLASENGETKSSADALYKKLLDKGVETLYDDRDLRVGEKFADDDLLGLPIRLVVSDKTAKAGKIEFKRRIEDKSELLSEAEVMERVVSL